MANEPSLAPRSRWLDEKTGNGIISYSLLFDDVALLPKLKTGRLVTPVSVGMGLVIKCANVDDSDCGRHRHTGLLPTVVTSYHGVLLENSFCNPGQTRSLEIAFRAF